MFVVFDEGSKLFLKEIFDKENENDFDYVIDSKLKSFNDFNLEDFLKICEEV